MQILTEKNKSITTVQEPVHWYGQHCKLEVQGKLIGYVMY